MEEPKNRDCAFQCNWDEDDNQFGCQIIDGSEGNYYCDKSICPFWKEHNIRIEQSEKIKEEIDKKEFE